MSINFSHTLWSPSDTVKDVAETLGISNLPDEVSKTLAMDVEYRIHEVIEQALKFMRHSKRTTLGTADISEALRVLNVEPLYGYEGATNDKNGVSYREAIVGPGQTLYYVDDDEVDFERLINQPLPKVPRATSLTAHWVAIDGVQPAIPQNPLASDIRAMSVDLRGAQTTSNSIATLNASSDVKVKPLVKHVLSKELQLYFDRVVGALMEGSEPDATEAATKQHAAALSSLRNDPGFHQLVPYFVQFVAEKVTHNLKHLPVLYTMLQVVDALLTNPTLFMDPYVHSVMPSVLTLVLAKKIGPKPGHEESVGDEEPIIVSQYTIRDFAASLLARICDKYNEIYQSLKPRAIRTLLKAFMDPTKPIGTLYGALQGIQALGNEAIRVVVVGNLKLWSETLYTRLAKPDSKTEELEMLNKSVISALRCLKNQAIYPDVELTPEELERCKELIGDKIFQLTEPLTDFQQIVHGLVDFEGKDLS